MLVIDSLGQGNTGTMIIALTLVATFFLAFLITTWLIPPVQRLCERCGWVAEPGGRRLHAHPTPTIGGIAMYIGLVVTLLATFTFGFIDSAFQRSEFETMRIWLVILASLPIFLIMWADDVRELPALPRLLVQIIAGLIAVGSFLWTHERYLAPNAPAGSEPTEAYGILLTAFNFPFVEQINLWNMSPWLAIGATVFWLMAMSNAINWADGADGLAAGITLVAGITLALKALLIEEPQFTIALLPLTIAGVCAAFLRFNLPPARIFMGDSGAHVLGFVLGISAIIGGAKLATILLVLAVPIIDSAWLIVSRMVAGHSPSHGGRDHLHHRLIDLGYTPRQVLIFYYTLSTSFGLVGLSPANAYIKLALLIILGLIVLGLIIYANMHADNRQQTATNDQ